MAYTLPITHSCGAAARAVSHRRYNFDYRTMPDFGGSIDTAEVSLKNNIIGAMPYKAKYVTLPIIVNDEVDNRTLALQPSRRLDSNLLFVQRDNDEQFLCYISHDTLKYYRFPLQVSFDPESWLITRPDDFAYSRELQEPAKGLYHSLEQPRYFLVNFNRSISLYKFRRKKSGQRANGKKSKPFKRLASIDPENSTDQSDGEPFDYVRDACLNNFMPEMIGIACDYGSDCQVRLYDALRSKVIRCISWSGLELSSPAQTSSEDNIIEPEVLTTVRPQPTHLHNLIYSTNFRTGIFDSRSPSNGNILVTSSALPSTFAWERFYGLETSALNQYQFYLISDFHLRVFDQRYLNTTINQVSHLLEVTRPVCIASSVGTIEGVNTEKVCLSDSSRTCLMSFNRHATEPVVNPISLHPPYHTSRPSDCFLKIRGELQQLPAESRFSEARVTGVHIAEHVDTNQEDRLANDDEHSPCFDILQLTHDGSIFSQRFYRNTDTIHEGAGPAYIGQSLHRGDPCPIKDDVINRISEKFSRLQMGRLRIPEVNYNFSKILHPKEEQEDLIPEVEQEANDSISSRTRSHSSESTAGTNKANENDPKTGPNTLTRLPLKSELLKRLELEWNLD